MSDRSWLLLTALFNGERKIVSLDMKSMFGSMIRMSTIIIALTGKTRRKNSYSPIGNEKSIDESSESKIDGKELHFLTGRGRIYFPIQN